MKLLKFKEKTEDPLYNRLLTIEDAIYDKGEVQYIDHMLNIIHNYASNLDTDDINVMMYQARLEEAMYWWDSIPEEDRPQESQNEQNPEI
jgi:hypothetical protein